MRTVSRRGSPRWMSCRAWLSVALVASIAAAGAAQAGGGPPGRPPAAPAPAPATGNGTVSGTVTDEAAKPLAGAEVKVYRPDRKEPWTATSDAKGFFAVRGLPQGPATVRFHAKGRIAVDKAVVVAATGLTLADAKLEPGVRYSGKVADLRGGGITGVKVSASKERPERAGMFWFAAMSGPSDEATSGADGGFVIDGLEPSQKYELKFRHPHYLPTTLPGLNAEAGVGIDGIEAILEDAAWVTGTVLDPTGKPIVGARVARAGDDDESEGQTIDLGGFTVFVRFVGAEDKTPRTDAKGKFEIPSVKPLEEGEALVLRAHADGFFPGEVRIEALPAGKEKGGVVVTLEAGKSFLEGVVVDDLDKPVKGADVAADSEDNGRVGATKTDAAGKFRLERVATKEPVQISASAAGFQNGAAEKVAVDTKDTRIVVRRLGKLKVRVLGADGKPVATVIVKRIVAEDGKEHPAHVEEVAQGPQGLELPIEPISIEVRVAAKGYEDASVGDWQVEPGQVIEGGEVKLEKSPEKPKDGKKNGGDGDDGGN
jgi:hypothetical protein